jgi:glycosyltransferase involved in cell wall biosynthesis
MLTLLIPVYNGMPFICETLYSIVPAKIGCKLVPKIIISDNKSTDSSVEVINKTIHEIGKDVDCKLYEQAQNLGCYGNLAFLQGSCHTQWGYILCSDDTLRPGIIKRLTAELAAVDSSISMVAFEDQQIPKYRHEVKKINGGPIISGKKGIALLFLYGCFIGGLSNACIRPSSIKSVTFNSEFKYFGDIKFYVDLLMKGGSILLSDLATNYRRDHADQISKTGGNDNTHFAESKYVVSQCIDYLSRNHRSRLVLLAFAHSVLYYQFYRLAINRAFAGNLSAFVNLARHHRGGIVSAFAFCVFSCFMVMRPLRESIRHKCQLWVLNDLC